MQISQIIRALSFLFLILQSCASGNHKNIQRQAASAVFDSHYIKKTADFYQITQNMIQRFDTELDRVYQLKKTKPVLTPEDLENFEKQKIELRLAWEFTEKNLDQLSDQYAAIIDVANTNGSKYQFNAKSSLEDMSALLEKNWNNGYRLPIVSVAQHLSSVNFEFQKINSFQSEPKVIDFEKYLKPMADAKKILSIPFS